MRSDGTQRRVSFNDKVQVHGGGAAPPPGYDGHVSDGTLSGSGSGGSDSYSDSDSDGASSLGIAHDGSSSPSVPPDAMAAMAARAEQERVAYEQRKLQKKFARKSRELRDVSLPQPTEDQLGVLANQSTKRTVSYAHGGRHPPLDDEVVEHSDESTQSDSSSDGGRSSRRDRRGGRGGGGAVPPGAPPGSASTVPASFARQTGMTMSSAPGAPMAPGGIAYARPPPFNPPPPQFQQVQHPATFPNAYAAPTGVYGPPGQQQQPPYHPGNYQQQQQQGPFAPQAGAPPAGAVPPVITVPSLEQIEKQVAQLYPLAALTDEQVKAKMDNIAVTYAGRWPPDRIKQEQFSFKAQVDAQKAQARQLAALHQQQLLQMQQQHGYTDSLGITPEHRLHARLTARILRVLNQQNKQPNEQDISNLSLDAKRKMLCELQYEQELNNFIVTARRVMYGVVSISENLYKQFDPDVEGYTYQYSMTEEALEGPYCEIYDKYFADSKMNPFFTIGMFIATGMFNFADRKRRDRQQQEERMKKVVVEKQEAEMAATGRSSQPSVDDPTQVGDLDDSDDDRDDDAQFQEPEPQPPLPPPQPMFAAPPPQQQPPFQPQPQPMFSAPPPQPPQQSFGPPPPSQQPVYFQGGPPPPPQTLPVNHPAFGQPPRIPVQGHAQPVIPPPPQASAPSYSFGGTPVPQQQQQRPVSAAPPQPPPTTSFAFIMRPAGPPVIPSINNATVEEIDDYEAAALGGGDDDSNDRTAPNTPRRQDVGYDYEDAPTPRRGGDEIVGY